MNNETQTSGKSNKFINWMNVAGFLAGLFAFRIARRILPNLIGTEWIQVESVLAYIFDDEFAYYFIIWLTRYLPPLVAGVFAARKICPDNRNMQKPGLIALLFTFVSNEIHLLVYDITTYDKTFSLMPPIVSTALTSYWLVQSLKGSERHASHDVPSAPLTEQVFRKL